MATRHLLPLLFALLAGTVAAEGVYKWIDAQGHTHFGSTPPPGQKTERLNTPSAGSGESPPATASRSWQEQLDLSNQRRQQSREKAQSSAQAEQGDRQRCLSARNALDSLERGGARYYLNAQGEREYLDDAQRQAARDAAAQRVATYCR